MLHFLTSQSDKLSKNKVVMKSASVLSAMSASVLSAMSARAFISGIVELRTYKVRVPRFAEFLQATSRLLHLRLRHSPLLGYWTCEVPNLNQVVHMWHYENLEHRAELRSVLAQNREWTENYIKPYLHTCVTKQNNAVLKSIGNFNSTSSNTTGIHEMEFVKLSGFGKIHQAAVENLCDKLHENSSRKSQFIGGLRTVIGSNEIVFLHQHDDMNQMLENQLARSHFYEKISDKIASVKSQLLVPHHIAPEPDKNE